MSSGSRRDEDYVDDSKLLRARNLWDHGGDSGFGAEARETKLGMKVSREGSVCESHSVSGRSAVQESLSAIVIIFLLHGPHASLR